MKNSFRLTCISLFAGAALIFSACSDSKMLPQKNNVENIINEQIQKEEGGTQESTQPQSPGSLSNHAGAEEKGGEGERKEPETSPKEGDKTESEKETPLSEQNAASLPAPQNIGGPEYEQIDYDLSEMTPDLVYASVYQLMVEPFEFEGKVFRMTGNYYATWYDPTQRYYHYLVIEDAAACCAQGIEFVMGDGSAKYPEEYPKSNSVLEITGVFETYQEEGDDRIYCRIKDANVKLVREIE